MAAAHASTLPRMLLRHRRRLLFVAAGLIIVLGGGAALAWWAVNRSVPDIHNGATLPFTPSTTTSVPTTQEPTSNGKPKKNFGPPWPIYGRVPARTRDASDLTSVKPPFGGVWDMKQRALLEFPPSYANGVLYLGRDDGWVLAINLYTRKVLWKHRFPPVPDQPALWQNLVIFGTFDQPGSVVAVNKDTGKVRWRRRLT